MGPAIGIEKMNPANNPVIDMVMILSPINTIQDDKILALRLSVFAFASSYMQK
jgi:hypothetical protein